MMLFSACSNDSIRDGYQRLFERVLVAPLLRLAAGHDVSRSTPQNCPHFRYPVRVLPQLSVTLRQLDVRVQG
jgi:hypothetical protein